MKVTVTDAPSGKSLDYPKLMTTKENLLVLMTYYGEGIYLRGGNDKVGSTYLFYDMAQFTDYVGTITLENSND